MSRIVVMNHVTLDGVIQAPGHAEEDTRGGFTHGGWGQRSITADDDTGKAMGERMAAGGGLAGWLFGRRTYAHLMDLERPGRPVQGRAQRRPQVRRLEQSRDEARVAELDAVTQRYR
jgi:hypothetical protein